MQKTSGLPFQKAVAESHNYGYHIFIMSPSPDKYHSAYGIVRKYGSAPFSIAVLHGGPGAPGYMAPVARELAKYKGVLEPIQSAGSVERQIDELAEQLINTADFPVTLIGSSWGAVLALFMAARKDAAINKLILIGSAVFDAAKPGETPPLP
jgi:pimeloyl-ACP methyl ester carboxylesterase